MPVLALHRAIMSMDVSLTPKKKAHVPVPSGVTHTFDTSTLAT